jgi:DNA-binding protein Fis
MSQPLISPLISNPWSRSRLKEKLEQLALQMHRSGAGYSAAVREFQKMFLATVLREQNGNQVRAAKILDMHRNTLRRQIHDMALDVGALRGARRRPPSSERISVGQKKVRTAR